MEPHSPLAPRFKELFRSTQIIFHTLHHRPLPKPIMLSTASLTSSGSISLQTRPIGAPHRRAANSLVRGLKENVQPLMPAIEGIKQVVLQPLGHTIPNAEGVQLRRCLSCVCLSHPPPLRLT